MIWEDTYRFKKLHRIRESVSKFLQALRNFFKFPKTSVESVKIVEAREGFLMVQIFTKHFEALKTSMKCLKLLKIFQSDLRVSFVF